MGLQEYVRKRNFRKTKEPRGRVLKGKDQAIFVVQKHHASHLHYDFRLEMDGVLKSWAIPKGPSLNPKDKRLAVQVEDHPLDYADFEGHIPEGEYGGGDVIVWDTGKWVPRGNPIEQLKKGRLEFELKGKKLAGSWILLRTRMQGAKAQWLLIKRNDEAASERDILKENKSVLSGKTLDGERLAKTSVKPAKAVKKSIADQWLEPQLATLVDEAPVGKNWAHEIKFDGYRAICRLENGKAQILTRAGNDWSHRFPSIQKECEKLPIDSVVLDGEIVWLDEHGVSNFQKLQNMMEKQIEKNLRYYVFDILSLEGKDVTNLPLSERKTLLKKLLDSFSSKKILYSDHRTEAGKKVFSEACKLGLEGIISKDLTSPYLHGRTKSWLKVKCKNAQEFVIVGYTVQTKRKAIGALLAGAYNAEGKLQYVGQLGTGYTKETHKMLLSKLEPLTVEESFVEEKLPHEKGLIWVKPQLVAQVEFGSWTNDGYLRHAAFKGLREDKPAKEVRIEKAKSTPYELTHPDKVLFADENITKAELGEYYESVKDLILPHIIKRPLALIRCPGGRHKECFFQKHIESDGAGVLNADMKSRFKKGPEKVSYIDSIDGLIELVQLGSLELHVRGCKLDNIDHPDVLIFDLDPGDDVDFKRVKAAAIAIRELLADLELKSFVKVTGGKGLHVHVPIEPRYDWEQIKNFTETVCEKISKEHSGEFITRSSKAKRKDKIFLDYLRNSFGATAVCAYSVRSKPGAPVALPLHWEDLKALKAPNLFKLRDVVKKAKSLKDPWTGYFKLKQRIKILES